MYLAQIVDAIKSLASGGTSAPSGEGPSTTPSSIVSIDDLTLTVVSDESDPWRSKENDDSWSGTREQACEFLGITDEQMTKLLNGGYAFLKLCLKENGETLYEMGTSMLFRDKSAIGKSVSYGFDHISQHNYLTISNGIEEGVEIIFIEGDWLKAEIPNDIPPEVAY